MSDYSKIRANRSQDKGSEVNYPKIYYGKKITGSRGNLSTVYKKKVKKVRKIIYL